MYLDLQGIFISVIMHCLSLVPINIYIKQINFLKYDIALPTQISKANCIMHIWHQQFLILH
jgi:hypothetical protein